MTRVDRPIVRSFKARFVAECVAWVKLGGHAIYWESPSRALLVFPKPKKNDEMDLGYWSVLDLGKSAYDVNARGVFKGLASSRVPRSCNDIVKRRATRDSIHEGPTRTVRFDCLTCAACCKDNEVILEDADFVRFEEGGRPELGKPPLTVKRDGHVVLRLLKNKRCRHLKLNNMCGVYDVRPNACRDFPVASECCLFAREEGTGLIDGLFS